jgi:type I restriction enzyme R subunit
LQSANDVRVTIEKILDEQLPESFSRELFEQKSLAVFQHVYDSYYGEARSVYSVGG